MLQITKPTLLLDKSICIQNMERMAARAKSAGLSLRPHCKTHQSHEIAAWLRDFGVTGITVSSFDMAVYFASWGWTDILVAFPFNPLEINRLNELATRCNISVLADHAGTLASLNNLDNKVGLYLDVDPGYGRTGIRPDQLERMEVLIQQASKNRQLVFSGFYCHAGHSYKARSRTGLEKLHRQATSELSDLKKHFRSYGPRILYGDTPNCSIQTDFQGVDEITPGNFVFYDLTQAAIGSCKESDIAVAMVCPVTGKYPDSKKLLIHGGAVHFSKETLDVKGQPVYGKRVNFTPSGWSPVEEGCYITSISQEHGIVVCAKQLFEHTRIGDLMAFHPVHSCLTANLMKEYTTMDGMVFSMC